MNSTSSGLEAAFKSKMSSRAAMVFLFAFALNIAGTWSLPLMDRDEPRFAEATREMRQRQEWLVPYFNNQYRFDKPPLTYWAQEACCKVFGESDWAVRLPSVLAAALTSLVLFYWGRRAVDERTGFWAAIIFATGLQVMAQSKLCLADPLLVLFVALTAWAGWEIVSAEDGEAGKHALFWSVVFTAGLALGFLAKGPIAWIPLGMLAAQYWRRAAGRTAWKRLAVMLLVSVALVMLWAVPALRASQGGYFSEGIGHQVVARGFTPYNGHGSHGFIVYLALLPFYFVTIFASFFPWSLALPWLARRLRLQTVFDELTFYLVFGIALVFGIFTFYNTRLPHYILPAFPLLALLLAREWFRADRGTLLLRRGVIAMTIFNFAAALVIFPMLKSLSAAPKLASLARPWLTSQTEFAAAGFDEPSLVWYFRARTGGYLASLPPKAVPGFMAKPGPRLCVLPVALADQLFPVVPKGCLIAGEASGVDLGNTRQVHLRIIVKPEPPDEKSRLAELHAGGSPDLTDTNSFDP